jgi:hypothetical protein
MLFPSFVLGASIHIRAYYSELYECRQVIGLFRQKSKQDGTNFLVGTSLD